MLALAMQEAGELASNTLVTTVMSNLGPALWRCARRPSRCAPPASATATSSKNCARVSTRSAANSPATSSCRRFGTTGDGIVTGLRLMSRMAQTRTSLAALAEPMQTLPQVLINVEVADKATVADAPSVRTAVAEAEAELGDSGRILLRPSGTEQVVRVMVEAADEDTARQLAVRVAESVSDQR